MAKGFYLASQHCRSARHFLVESQRRTSATETVRKKDKGKRAIHDLRQGTEESQSKLLTEKKETGKKIDIKDSALSVL